MVDEEKQIDNTANLPGDTLEVKRVMTSEATAETMNLNDEGTPANAQEAEPAAQSSDHATVESATQVESQEVQSLKAQLEDRTNQYMRIAADFDNFRKRTQKEKEDSEQQVKRATITELLAVVDNFERARSHIKPQTDAEMSIHKSYQSVYKQLVDSLKRLGVSAMRPEGQEFDPNLHEAVMRQPTNEHPEGTVLEELVRGYFLGDRVLRHALVKVSAGSESGETVEENPASATTSE